MRALLIAALAAISSCTPTRISASRIWVKRPGSKKLEIVSSLAHLCSKHSLDEEAMIAVMQGEADDHEGWECGEVECDDEADATDKDADAQTKAEVAAASEQEEEPPATTPPAPALSSKMIVGLLAPMAGVQVLKRFEKKANPNFLLGLRGCFTACVAAHTAIDFLVRMRIDAANETAMVKSSPNPLSLIMGGGFSAVQQTAREYDLSQLGSMRNSFRMGVVVVALLHWKFKFNQVLVYHAVQALVDLAYHPLVQIHLLGRDAIGALSRPFGAAPGQPDMSALFKGMSTPVAPAS